MITLHRYKKQSTLSCPLDKIFQIVIDIEKYPDFLPWCKAVHIKKKVDDQIIVDLVITFYNFKKKYTSNITFLPPNKINECWIKVTSTNGIFKYLYNEWKFIPMNKNTTVVKFYIEFKFKSNSLSTILSLVYKYVQNRIIDAFEKRIKKLASSDKCNESKLDIINID
ncbi:MAG: type II toxin-antitoxin system RatA family toxin [Wolbachia endosymbiont of Menacanthus eurysternus]|nr:MAG: type II toxin-antitoxin system RatA family toxin [Wolbachia endosymbiont of Menacanthus eurysternus]